MKNKDYITKTALLKRGWTESILNKFIPEPHETKPNYLYKNAPPMKLYKIEVIKKIKKTKKFKDAIDKIKNRRNGAKKAIETKKKKLMQQINSIEFEIPILTRNKLLKRSIDHYNNRQILTERYENYADKKSDKLFLERIQVNYIRHMLSSYEENLKAMKETLKQYKNIK